MVLECLMLAAAEGVRQDLAYSNLLLKAFKCVGKGTERFCRKQGDRPKPFSSDQAATQPASSTKVTTQNPSKAAPDVAKRLPKSRPGWMGRGLFPMSAATTLWPTLLASPSGTGRDHGQPAGLPRDGSFEGHGGAADCGFCLPRALFSPCVIGDRSWANA